MLLLPGRVAGVLTLFSFVVLRPLPLAAATGLARQLPTESATTTSTSTSSGTATTTTSTTSSSTSSTTSSTPTSTLPSTSPSTLPSTSSSSSSSTSSSTSTVSSSSSSSSPSITTVSTSTTKPSSSPAQHTFYTTSFQYSTSIVRDPASSTSSATGGSGATSGNNNGFFENKGAVGGTFAAVGLVGVALIGGLVYFLINRHRKSRDDEEVDAYFEKPHDAGVYRSEGGRSSTDLTFPHDNAAYPTRDVFYRAPYVNYNDPRSYGMDYPPDTSSSVNTRPVSAAPGTAYAAAISQQGPYQYNPQPVDGHHDAPAATGSNPDPFVDPVRYSGPHGHDDAYVFGP